MAIGTGHRSNNYSESKRNDHLDNNLRQEQRNKVVQVLREEMFVGWECDLVYSFDKARFVMIGPCIMYGCFKVCMEKNLEDDDGKILEVHSQGVFGNVTTVVNEDV
ncbi:hypothetical protein Tco_0704022 [Tanacetum coccineum]|uniref:Uncharacterized protein n=1 Tax=Tanacetum coccineum TaxID=301880 RepID=A0ABQ4Y1F5_9ASTR